ncbi:MAG: c-type cytochrome [Cyanobacteria bacterium P01_A01_bin.45]
MRKLFSILVAGLVMLSFAFAPPALAGDAASGKAIFAANCNACHLGGNNVVNAAKTLKKADLEKYEKNSLEAIVYQVSNGKNAMPAFKGRLNDKQIEDVAAYVLQQADNGWS